MGTQEQGGFPEFDYHLDRSDVLVLRRQDGSFVAAFDAREVTSERIVEAAKADHARSLQARDIGPSGLQEDNARKGSSANDAAERRRLGAASRAADAEEDRTPGDRRKAKKALRRSGFAARTPRPPAEGGEEMTNGRPIGGTGGCGLPSTPRERTEHIPERHHGRVRWYNPILEDFEWRGVPQTDEQAFHVLDGLPCSPACIEAYRAWRYLGASIKAALIRAGEMAKAEREREK